MDHLDIILAEWRQERPDLDVSAMGTLGRIKLLWHHLARAMDKTFAAHGLNAASFDVLATLLRCGPPYALSPGDLMTSTLVTSGTMTNRIDQLEKAGLVQRTANPQDGRGLLVSLSAKGHEVIKDALTAHAETQKRLVASLTNEQRTQLDELLRCFLSGVKRQNGDN